MFRERPPPNPSVCAIARWCIVYLAVPDADLRTRSASSPLPCSSRLRVWFIWSRMAVAHAASDAVQSSVFWPLIAGSVVLTELASAVAAKLAPGALTLALVAAPLVGLKASK